MRPWGAAGLAQPPQLQGLDLSPGLWKSNPRPAPRHGSTESRGRLPDQEGFTEEAAFSLSTDGGLEQEKPFPERGENKLSQSEQPEGKAAGQTSPPTPLPSPRAAGETDPQHRREGRAGILAPQHKALRPGLTILFPLGKTFGFQPAFLAASWEGRRSRRKARRGGANGGPVGRRGPEGRDRGRTGRPRCWVPATCPGRLLGAGEAATPGTFSSNTDRAPAGCRRRRVSGHGGQVPAEDTRVTTGS